MRTAVDSADKQSVFEALMGWLRQHLCELVSTVWSVHILPTAVALGLLANPASASFPFSMDATRFMRSGAPVFLNVIGYQPLEPDESQLGEIRPARVAEDLRRWAAYRCGSDPVALRVYAQPTQQFPQRMPQVFYDGVRDLDWWIIRNIYFGSSANTPSNIAAGKAAIDAVINEAESAGGLDRIFAWQLGDEFQAFGSPSDVESFLCTMRDYLKSEMAKPGRQGFSDWVTWTSWVQSDPLFTSGNNPILPSCLDFVSYNVYGYEPDRLRDQQAGPISGTPYAGYLAALKARYPTQVLLVSETGLANSAGVNSAHAQYQPWYPVYRKGGLTSEQVAEGLADRYWDARLSGLVAGTTIFEWNDEAWKGGADPAEPSFGLSRFAGLPYRARYKLQQEVVHDLFTLQLPSSTPVLTALTADATTLAPTGSTTLHAMVAGPAVLPVRFRWEASRGRVVGDTANVQLYAGGHALGPAAITVVGIDASGRGTTATTSITIQPLGSASIEVLTVGTTAASGRVADVDLGQYKVVAYVQTNQLYVQPYVATTDIWVRPDGYWWTSISNGFGGQLFAWLVPQSYAPPATLPMGSMPPNALAMASIGVNDTDNDLLPDNWETTHFGSTASYGRNDDPDNDRASNLEEYIAGTDPLSADNDSDADGLPDNWERIYFGTLAYNGADDPDGDGISNQQELLLGTHPGRASLDRDRDGLPDEWEYRWFGDLTQNGPADPNHTGRTSLDAYELGVSPACPGDCNKNHAVTIGEVLRCVSHFLGEPLCNAGMVTTSCLAGDVNLDGKVSIGEVLQCVNRFLKGC